MEKLWITAEVAVQRGDMPSGDTLGFMKVLMWASSHENFVEKLNEYLCKYQWSLLSLENTEVVDPSEDYGNDENQICCRVATQCDWNILQLQSRLTTISRIA